MLRDTMIRTMPVAMIAIDALCTDRFHRLRAVRKSPPERMWNPTQMTPRPSNMPNRRVSISVDARTSRHDRAGFAVGSVDEPDRASIIVTLSHQE